MYGLETIRTMNMEAGRKARGTWGDAERKASKALSKAVLVEPDGDVVGVPFLGDAGEDIDTIAERVDTLFVDISGFGTPFEPALTKDQFISRLHELAAKHGALRVAMESHGAFQGYVGVWKEPARDSK